MVVARIKQVKFPAAEALVLDDVMAIYRALCMVEKTRKRGACRPELRLVDILDEFDGLVLDGYGVINVGNGPISGIKNLLDAAACRGKPVVGINPEATAIFIIDCPTSSVVQPIEINFD